MREHRGWIFIGAGVIALGLYGFVATLRPDAHFGRILAAYGGVFVAGSLAWGMVADGYRPDRFDMIGALICFDRGRGHPVCATRMTASVHSDSTQARSPNERQRPPGHGPAGPK